MSARIGSILPIDISTRPRALKGMKNVSKTAEISFFLSLLLFHTFYRCHLSEMSFSSFFFFFFPGIIHSLSQQMFAEHVLFVRPCTRPDESDVALLSRTAPPSAVWLVFDAHPNSLLSGPLHGHPDPRDLPQGSTGRKCRSYKSVETHGQGIALISGFWAGAPPGRQGLVTTS